MEDTSAYWAERAARARSPEARAARQQAGQAQKAYWKAYWSQPHSDRVPLTPGQHILHLILTVCTGGLWGIVWIIRAAQGNRRMRRA
jgi:hypothetical protein